MLSALPVICLKNPVRKRLCGYVHKCRTDVIIFVTFMAHEKKCINCGKTFSPKRSDAETCSGTCRAEIHVMRKKAPELTKSLESLAAALPYLDEAERRVVISEVVRMIPDINRSHSPAIRLAMKKAEAAKAAANSKNQPVMGVVSKADQEAAMKELSKHLSKSKQVRSKDYPDLTVRGKK